MSEQNKDICRRAVEEFINQKKLELSDQIYHPDFRLIDPDHPEGMVLTIYLESRKTLFTSFPDFHAKIVDMITKGETVALVWRAQGTFKADWGDLPANNKLISWYGVDVNKFQDGKIVECLTAFDNLGPAMEMGWVQTAVPAVE